jgi:phospholipase C
MVFARFRNNPKQRPSRKARHQAKSGSQSTVQLGIEQLEERSLLSADPTTLAAFDQNINHVVVVYQENWSFDSLYGFFPGANGIPNATNPDESLKVPQVDKNGNVITTLPPVKGPDGQPDPRFPTGLPAQPFDMSPFIQTSTATDPAGITGDLIHRFYTEQAQIDGGKMDKFVAWSDNPGLTLSYVDATNLPEGQLAQQYTLADNFFHAAFGGSFLNHQFLVSAAAPQWLQSLPTTSTRFVSKLNPDGTPIIDGNLTADGKFVVNTTQPADAPHANVPTDQLLKPINDTDPSKPGYQPTIGDLLDNRMVNGKLDPVSWTWYSGGWSNALAGHPATDPRGFGEGFQFHHQPFDYYQNFAPFNPDGTPNSSTDSLLTDNSILSTRPHLQDETQFFQDLFTNNLPSVSFVKPLGENNEHPGYADLLQGQQHVADIVHAVQASPDWAHTAIVITYDENGGRWDHVSPPDNNGIWGDGSRVPAIIISPFAKKGFVDHQEMDTLSIMKTIEERFLFDPATHTFAHLNNFDGNANDLLSAFAFPATKKEAHQLDKLEDEAMKVRSEIIADQQTIETLQADIKQDQTELTAVQAKISQDLATGDLKAFKQDVKQEAKIEEDIAKDLGELKHQQNDIKQDTEELNDLNAELAKLK